LLGLLLSSPTAAHSTALQGIVGPSGIDPAASLTYRHTRGHALNERSSRSHAVITIHFDSWAQPGSREDQDAAEGEQLLALLQRARALASPELCTESEHGKSDHTRALATSETGNETERGNSGCGHALASPEPSNETGRGKSSDASNPGYETEWDSSCRSCKSSSQQDSEALRDEDNSVPAKSKPTQCSTSAVSAGKNEEGVTRSFMQSGAGPPEQRRMKRYGKLVLVDLAGSERLKESGSSGTGAAETGAINKSLFTLGQVLHALSSRRESQANPPPVCALGFSWPRAVYL
jgi:hypothetical protein